MKPALSVLFFTVSSGAGLGMLILLVLSRFAHSAQPSSTWWVALGLSMLLITAGLLSSTQHLANPKNAWRAFSRFATSWLSREGVFAVILYPAVAVYAFALFKQWGALSQLMGLAVLAVSLAVLVCTAMIYACLKTIPRWNTWQTIVQYPVFGLMSGALILMAIIPDAAAVVVKWLAVGTLVVGALVKCHHYCQFDKPAGITLSDALRQSWGKPRLLDMGHSHESFLTREFGFQVEPGRAMGLKIAVALLAFVVPLVIVLVAAQAAWLAALLCLIGLFVERWLFFAEARHVVNLYHGAQRV